MVVSAEGEARLQRLIAANDEESRAGWAKEWQQAGGKVVGVLCTYVPVEVLIAAGIMPWRVSGTWSQNIEDALVIRSGNSCGFCNHILQSLLDGELNFLDGVVATTWEQDMTRLWDVWRHLGKTGFCHILHLPHHLTAEAIRYYAGEIGEFVSAVEGLVGRKIADGELRRAIALCNRRRELMQEVYALRKREVPPLSGAEMVGLTVAGTVMPVEQFNQELAELIPYLMERRTELTALAPRILVSSDFVDNPGYVEAIESLGCLVAMDDFDTGSRYYDKLVERNGKDAPTSLAESYLGRVGSARMVGWEDQVEAVVQWVKEYRISGVIELAQRYSRAREMRRPYFLSRLQRAGVMAISLEREYPLTNVGQLRTRTQAFLEMLEPVD